MRGSGTHALVPAVGCVISTRVVTSNVRQPAASVGAGTALAPFRAPARMKTVEAPTDSRNFRRSMRPPLDDEVAIIVLRGGASPCHISMGGIPHRPGRAMPGAHSLHSNILFCI